MQKVTHFIPTDLEWMAHGQQCEPRILNRMCKDILAHGTIIKIHPHTSAVTEPDGTQYTLGIGSQALTVVCHHIPCITYVIHLTGFRVIEIIETIIIEAGA